MATTAYSLDLKLLVPTLQWLLKQESFYRIGMELSPAFTEHHCWIWNLTTTTWLHCKHSWTKKFRSFMKKNNILCFFLRKVSHKGHSLFISTKPAKLLPPPKPPYFFHLPCRIEIWPCGQKCPVEDQRWVHVRAWLKLSSVCGLQTQRWPLEPWFYMMFYGPLALEKGNTWQRWNLKTC